MGHYVIQTYQFNSFFSICHKIIYIQGTLNLFSHTDVFITKNNIIDVVQFYACCVSSLIFNTIITLQVHY